MVAAAQPSIPSSSPLVPFALPQTSPSFPHPHRRPRRPPPVPRRRSKRDATVKSRRLPRAQAALRGSLCPLAPPTPATEPAAAAPGRREAADMGLRKSSNEQPTDRWTKTSVRSIAVFLLLPLLLLLLLLFYQSVFSFYPVPFVAFVIKMKVRLFWFSMPEKRSLPNTEKEMFPTRVAMAQSRGRSRREGNNGPVCRARVHLIVAVQQQIVRKKGLPTTKPLREGGVGPGPAI